MTEPIKPMLCELCERVHNDPGVIYEEKYDGVRAVIVAKPDGTCEIQSRSGKSKDGLYPELSFDTKGFTLVLDGEIVSTTGDFNNIQHRNRAKFSADAAKEFPVVFKAFDLLSVDGVNCENSTLETRKKGLDLYLNDTKTVQKSEFTLDGEALYQKVLASKLAGGVGEGVVGKRLDQRYIRDARGWMKVKLWQNDIFFVLGYTDGTGWRAGTFGAMILADKTGKYVGEVGTGFNNVQLKELYLRMKSNGTGVCPWPKSPLSENITWCNPFPVKLQYLEYTNDGKLRFPSYKGMI